MRSCRLFVDKVTKNMEYAMVGVAKAETKLGQNLGNTNLSTRRAGALINAFILSLSKLLGRGIFNGVFTCPPLY